MKALFTLLLFGLVPCSALAQPSGLLRRLAGDATDSTLSSPRLAEKYFSRWVLEYPGGKGDSTRQFLYYVLDEQRKHLRQHRIQPANISFVAYDKLPGPLIPPCPFHMLGTTQGVYVALYQGRILGFVWLREGKVASTLLIGQGDEHYFIIFDKP